MVRLDLKNMISRDVNRKLKELLKTENQIEIDNPHSIHNFATALIGQGKIIIHGSSTVIKRYLPSAVKSVRLTTSNLWSLFSSAGP